MNNFLENNTYYENNSNCLINEYSKQLLSPIYIDSIEIMNDFNNCINEDNNLIKNIGFVPDIINLDNSLRTGEKSTNIEVDNNKKTLPDFYSIDKIMDKIDNEEINMKLKKGKIEEFNEYYKMENLKKKKKYNKDVLKVIKIDIEKKKRGRKPKINLNRGHTRMDSDNIIKKIKALLFKNILAFLNNLFNYTTLNNIRLLKLDSKYVNQLNSIFELNLIGMKLKELLSLEVSSKIKKKGKKYNQQILEKIENKNIWMKDEKDYDTLMFILNLTFRDWLNLFTGKQNFRDLAEYYYVNESSIDINIIEKSFVGINEVLPKLKDNFNFIKESDEKYFANFIFFLFNYERWFLIKKPRKKINII